MQKSIWLVLILILASCGAEIITPQAPYQVIEVLQTVDSQHAQVELRLERDSTNQMILAATYQPKEPHLHLYSKDLPRNGVDGLGRPTLLELSQAGQIRSIGPIVADAIAAPDPTIETAKLLIYPAGPVTLRMPVELDLQQPNQQILLTFMLCSSKGYCTSSVEQLPVTIQLSNS
ncbi:MAG TPA: hypothetical protein DEF47_20135 [Herpetosiphon sp.]|uniref:Thiol:disulfide interchange protein DsbD N-terminal domain-containing protein n=1 Tax=Herpetosiphon aurantiacus (strain ATCC 23779 / DSM 785 / 114-95) TaxID=316274 RepID=A9AWG0_HERA2|nr:hypothetical protein [Herpetosiphon sp.]ABX06719.1 hypothetical protein Haur_4087 [Herpetosiphon aurantiacus DSM 785]HBW52203.1 hypothetical protein [Herpetosiphon sp.]